jgi:hypothetical protein
MNRGAFALAIVAIVQKGKERVIEYRVEVHVAGKAMRLPDE